MKRFTKVCLSLAGALAVVGVVLCIIGAAFGARFMPFRYGNWTFFWNDEADGSHVFGVASGEEDFLYTQEETAKVQNLDISVKAGSLQIHESDDNQIRMKVYSKRAEVEHKIENDTLVIQDRTQDVWWRTFKLEIHLYLPRDMKFERVAIDVNAGETDMDEICLNAKSMELNVDAGSISLESAAVQGELKASVGAGEIEIEDLYAENVNLECGMGSIDIAGKIDGNIDADCGVGEIHLDLDDSEENFDYSIECGMGEVEIGDISYTSFGKKKKIDNHAKKMMNLDCGLGTIEVEFN